MRQDPRPARAAVYPRLLKIFCTLTFALSAAAAQCADSSAAPPAARISKVHALGADAGGVNLYSGELEFTLPLASISGRNGLGWSLSANYNSNVMAEVGTSNAGAPTGAMGLGWTLATPKIVVDTKNTGTREDDHYYFAQGGQRAELVRTGTAADGGFQFATRAYAAWSMVFYPARERWEVLDENGVLTVYGDSALDPAQATLQWGVFIDNWRGPTSHARAADGATRLPVAYNLASMREPWGDTLTFFYTGGERKIGGADGLAYTRESYLAEVRNSAAFGERIVLSYADKANVAGGEQEYLDPHQLDAQFAYYQDRFETRYLDHVETYKKDSSSPTSRTNLTYSMLEAGKGAYAKRVLRAVQTFNEAGHAYGPPLRYDYYNNIADVNWGALKSATSIAGGQVVYQYAALSPALSQRDFSVPRPAGYDKVRSWTGEGFVFVMWVKRGADSEAGDTLLLQTYAWDGRWVLANTTELPGTRDWRSVKVATGPGMVALLRNTLPSGPCQGNSCPQLLRLHQDPYRADRWLQVTDDFYSTAGFLSTNNVMADFATFDVAAGDDFVAVGAYVSGSSLVPLTAMRSLAWRWNGSDWSAPQRQQVAYDMPATDPTGQHVFTSVRAAHNFYLTSLRCMDCADNFLDIRLQYFDALGMLHAGPATPISRDSFLPPDYQRDTALEAGDSFAVLQTPHNYFTTNGPTSPRFMLLDWSADFTQFRIRYQVDVPEIDQDYLPRISGNTVGIGRNAWQLNFGNPAPARAVALDAASLNSSAIGYTYGAEFAAGDNTAGGSNRHYAYDVKQDSWQLVGTLNSAGPVVASQNSLDFFTAANGAVVRKIALRNADGSWSTASSTDGRDFTAVLAGQDGLRSFHRAPPGQDFATLFDGADNSPVRIQLLDADWHFGAQGEARSGNKLTAERTVVAYRSGADSNLPEDANQLMLLRATSVYPYGFSGLQSVRVVQQVSLKNGYDEMPAAGLPAQTTRFTYVEATAAMSPDGRAARFNEAAVHQGAEGDDAVSTQNGEHYGISRVWFFNGLNPQDYDDQGTPLPQFAVNPVANGEQYYGLLEGQPYQQEQLSEKFDSASRLWSVDKKIAGASSAYSVFFRDLGRQGMAHYLRPVQLQTRQDSVPLTTTHEWLDASAGPLQGLLAATSVTQINEHQQPETTTTSLRYAQQVYGMAWPAAAHLLSPVAQLRSTRSEGGQTVTLAVAASTWKDWGGGKWGRLGSWNWQHDALHEDFCFNPQNGAQPCATSDNADWLQGAEPTVVDAYGTIIESKVASGTPQRIRYSSALQDRDGRFTVASFKNGRLQGATANASYWGMEIYEPDPGWTQSGLAVAAGDSNTGQRALRASLTQSTLSRVFTPAPPQDTAQMQSYVFSVHVKMLPGADQRLSMTLDAQTLDGPIQNVRSLAGADVAGGWQYLELYLHGRSISRIQPTLVVSAGVLVDDVVFAPVGSFAGAAVFDPATREVTDTLGENGEVQHVVRDEFGAPFAAIRADGSVGGVVLSALSREANQDVFSPAEPNSMTGFTATAAGDYDDFRSGSLSRWHCSATPPRAGLVGPIDPTLPCRLAQPGDAMTPRDGKWLELMPGTMASFMSSPLSDYAVRAKISGARVDFGQPVQIDMTMGGSLRVRFDGFRKQWQYFERGTEGFGWSWTLKESRAEPRAVGALPADWLLSYADGKVLFYIGGRKIFERPYGGLPLLTGAVPYFDPHLTITNVDEVTNLPHVFVSDVMIVNQPRISASFADGQGRTLQQLQRDGDDALVSGLLFNAHGSAVVRSKTARILGAATAFRPGFLQRDTSGKVAGELLGYYGANADLAAGYTDDGGYPYADFSEQVASSSTMQQAGAAGAQFNGQSPLSAGHVRSADHAGNSVTEPFLTSELGPFMPGNFQTGVTTDQNGVTSRSLQLASGLAVAAKLNGAFAYNGTMDLQTLRSRNPLGQVGTIYLPRFFAGAGNEPNAAKFKVDLAYSSTDLVNSLTLPNSGAVQSRFNQAGQLRFFKTANQPPGTSHYIMWDEAGRIIEAGTWAREFDSLGAAEIENAALPAASSIRPVWRIRFMFDTPVTSVAENSYQNGRLAGVQVNNNPLDAAPHDYVAQTFVRDAQGRVILTTERNGSFGTDRVTQYSYGFNGELRSIAYPIALQPVQLDGGNCGTPATPASPTALVSIVIDTVLDGFQNLAKNMAALGSGLQANVLSTISAVGPNSLYAFGAAGGCPAIHRAPDEILGSDINLGLPGLDFRLSSGLLVQLPKMNMLQGAPVPAPAPAQVSAQAPTNFDIHGAFSVDADGGNLTVQSVVLPAPFVVTYRYDRLGRLSAIGRMRDEAADDSYYAKYAYGPNGELLSESLNNSNGAGNVLSTRWTYDSRGAPLSASTSSGSTMPLLRYRENLRYTNVKAGETPTWDGRLAGMEQLYSADGIQQSSLDYSYTYYRDGALHEARASGSLPDADRYSFAHTNLDANRNVLQLRRRSLTPPNQPAVAPPAVTDDFSYAPGTDRLQRVTSSSADGRAGALREQSFDGFGNVTGITYTGGGDAVAARWQASLRYDPFFNLPSEISATSSPADPQHQGQLLLTYGGIEPARVADSYFDGQTRRISNTYFRGLGSEVLRIDRQESVIRSAPQQSRKMMVYGLTGLIAVNDDGAAQNGGVAGVEQDYFVVKDHARSTMMVLRQDGVLQQSYRYAPDGAIYTGDGQPLRSEPLVPYLYQGQQYDAKTGLHNFRARLYDSATARFLAPDSLFNPAESPYVAFGNDSANKGDRNGRFTTAWYNNHYYEHLGVGSLLLGTAYIVYCSMPALHETVTPTFFYFNLSNGSSCITDLGDGAGLANYTNTGDQPELYRNLTGYNTTYSLHPGGLIAAAAMANAGFFLLPQIGLFYGTLAGPVLIYYYYGQAGRCHTYIMQGMYSGDSAGKIALSCYNSFITMTADNANRQFTFLQDGPAAIADFNAAMAAAMGGHVPVIPPPRRRLWLLAAITQNFGRSLGQTVSTINTQLYDAMHMTPLEFRAAHPVSPAKEHARLVGLVYAGMLTSAIGREGLRLLGAPMETMMVPIPADVARLFVRESIKAHFDTQDQNISFAEAWDWSRFGFNGADSGWMHGWFRLDRTMNRQMFGSIYRTYP